MTVEPLPPARMRRGWFVTIGVVIASHKLIRMLDIPVLICYHCSEIYQINTVKWGGNMCINSIDVYNVLFGDCLYLHLDHRGVLVDCGSKRKSVYADPVIDDVLNNNEEMSLVVTHFHKDHYSLIQRFSDKCFFNKRFSHKRFSEVFVPDFFSRNSIRVQMYVLLLSAVGSKLYKNALAMLTLIPQIITSVKAETWINFVKKGDSIHSMPVLWPDPNEKTIKGLEEKMENLFRSYRRKTANDANDVVGQIIEKLNLYYNDYSTGNDSQNPHRVSAENIGMLDPKETAQKAMEKRDELGIPKEGILDRKTKKAVLSIQNSSSIVFHNTEGDNTALFLGDVDKKNYEKHVRPEVEKVEKQYRYIKVAHHGTRDYYTGELPVSSYLIISNGGWKSAPISCMYKNRYRKALFVCTNNNYCEYRQSLPNGASDSNCIVCGFEPWTKITLP